MSDGSKNGTRSVPATIPLIVGVGSPHGDDQAGWWVIAHLHSRGVALDCARVVQNPSDLWDWCSKDRALTVCDASVDGEPVGTVRNWTWPGDIIPSGHSGTHDIPVSEVLSLGAELGCVPERVTIWTISGEYFEPGSEPAKEVIAAAETLGDRLWRELQRA